MKKYLTLALIIIKTSYAQERYNIYETNIKIKGNSNIHEWVCEVKKSEGFLDLGENDKVLDGCVKININDIKSGKEIMNKNILEVLEYADTSYVIWKFKEVKKIKGSIIESIGLLTIKGKEKRKKIIYRIRKKSDQIRIVGVKKLKFSEFKIPPPVVLESIEVYDDLEIVYDIKLKKKPLD